jgi:hypothetical protein
MEGVGYGGATWRRETGSSPTQAAGGWQLPRADGGVHVAGPCRAAGAGVPGQGRWEAARWDPSTVPVGGVKMV